MKNFDNVGHGRKPVCRPNGSGEVKKNENRLNQICFVLFLLVIMFLKTKARMLNKEI